MTGKWLKRPSNDLVPARKPDKPVLQGDEFNRRVAQFMRDKGIVESFCVTIFCRVHEKFYITTFERRGPGELFKRVSVEPLQPSSGRGIAALSAKQAFNIEDVADWECPCGAGSWVNCSCGRISCNADREWWRCYPGCGAHGNLEPARTITGSKPGRKLSGSDNFAGALFKSASVPRLPGK